MKSAALELAKRGFRVFPLCPGTSIPALKEWQHKASVDPAEIVNWWESSHTSNIGIATGNGLLVIDLDVKKGGRGIDEWLVMCEENDYEPWMTLMSETPTGGRHLFFSTDKHIRNSAKRISRSIDVRGDGGFVVAVPSVKTEGNYRWLNNLNMSPAPLWLEQLCANGPKKNGTLDKPRDANADYSGELPPYSRRALEDEVDKVRSCPPGARNATLNAASYSLGQLVATPGSGLTEDACRAQLVAAATSAGLGEAEAVKTTESGLRAGMRTPRVGLDIRSGNGGSYHYQRETVTGTASKKKQALLTEDYKQLFEDRGWTFRLNELNDTIELNGEELTDVAEAVVIAQIRDYGIQNRVRISVDHAREAMATVAFINSYNPILKYFAQLDYRGGDPIGKLAGYMTDSQGQAPRWIEHWLVGAVARVFEGYQNPMLVLDGSQDQGKSYLARWLCPLPRLFQEGPISPENKDCLLRLAKCLVWEITELDATTRRSDVSALKAFLTLGEVRERKPFGRRDIVKPAVSSFIGTINNSVGFLADTTGSRRFHVLTLTKLNWNYARTINVHQVWAQAVELYKAGNWRLAEIDKRFRDSQNEDYMVEDPIETILSDVIDITGNYNDALSAIDILEVVSKRTNLNQKSVSMSISAYLKKYGVVKQRETRNGARVYTYRGVTLAYSPSSSA